MYYISLLCFSDLDQYALGFDPSALRKLALAMEPEYGQFS